MKKTSLTSPEKSHLYLLENGLILFFLTLKSCFFYHYIKLERFALVMTTATISIFLFLFIMKRSTSKRSPSNLLFPLYIVASVIMMIDRMYFAYFNKLPSILALQMVKYLGAVTSSVADIFNLSHAAYIIDLPILLLYLLFWRKKAAFILRRSRFRKPKHNWSKISIGTASGLLAGCLLFIGVQAFDDDFRFTYLKNELFSYHIVDMISVVGKQAAQNNIDPADYIQVIAPANDDADVNASGDRLNGIAQGMNLVNIQVEAMQAFVLGRTYNGQEITPFLNSLLASNTIFFDNYYYQIGGGNTSDAEFAVNNSLFTPESEAAYVKYTTNDYYGLPFILKDNGYSGAYAFHGYNGDFWNRREAYVYQGFDAFYAKEDLSQDDILGLGISDKSFFTQALDIMETFEEPFYTFMVTLSSHHPYDLPESLWQLELDPVHENTLFGDYLQTMRYVDEALKLFFDGLKEKGLYDNTVVTIYGDHFGLPNYDWYSKYYMTEWLGHEYYEADMYNVPLIIHIPGLGESQTCSITGGHVDYLPTILYLFGYTNTKSVMFGQNLLTATSGITYEQTHMARGSFISDDIIFVYPQNGILSNAVAYDKATGKIISSAGYEKISAAAIKAYEDCNALLIRNAVVLKP